MTDFCILDDEVDTNELWVSDYEAIDFLEFEARAGEALEADGAVATLVVDDDTKTRPQILIGIHPFLVVSESFRQTVKSVAGDQVQFFPVVVEYCDEAIEGEPYWFLNTLNNVACVDKEKSDLEISEISGIPIGVHKLVLDESALEGRDLVRVDEFPTILLVSKRLRSALESAGVPKRHFTNVSDYSDDDD